MAISHARPLLLLLASLFFLPVLRAIDFKYCNKSGYDYGKVTRVEISPNPIGPEDDPTIMVFGSASNASKSITEGTVEVFLRSGNRRRERLVQYDLCDDLHACPIEPGKNFVLYLSDVAYSVGIEGGLKVAVDLIDNFGESEDVEQERETRMCVDFYLPTSAPKLVSSA